MKKIILLLPFLFSAVVASGQSLFDNEIKRIIDQLTAEVSAQMKGRNIAVTDFVDSEGNASELGRYLTEEFSYALVGAATDFKVVDRSQLRKLLEEAGIGDKGMVDPESVQKLGRLKGISAVIYGKIIPIGNSVRIYTKVVILEELVNVITVRGDITRTPTIEGLLNKSSKKENLQGESQQQSLSAPFSYKNIQIALNGCRNNGQNTIQCDLLITSVGRPDNITLQTSDTYLADQSARRYRAQNLSSGGQPPSTVQVNCVLPQDQPVSVSVVFAGVPADIRNFEGLYLNCRSYAAFSFTANIKNILSR